MPDRYWIANGAEAQASVAGNWSDTPNGVGPNTVPIAGDTVYFGDTITLDAGFGVAPCEWNLNIALNSMYVYEGFSADNSVTSTGISFAAPSTINISGGSFLDAGLANSMQIVVSGSGSNDGTYLINSFSDTQLTVVSTGLSDEAAGASVTISNSLYVDVSSDFGTSLLSLNGTMKNTSGVAKTISLSGAWVDLSNRYVVNGDYAVLLNADDFVYDVDASTNGSDLVYLDDGPHGILTSSVSTNTFSPQYVEPTSTAHGACTLQSLNITAGKIQPDGSNINPRLDYSRRFNVTDATSIVYSNDTFDAGLSTWAFAVTSGAGWAFPVTGSTSYGAGDFTATWYDVILSTPGTAGWKTTIEGNTTLSVNSLIVEADAVLEGDEDYGPAVIITKSPPKVAGAWNFVGIGPSIFVSDRNVGYAVTPSHGAAGDLQVAKGNGHFDSRGLVAGTNVTITDDGTDITIASTGGGGGGAVDSVFGRTGTVVATEGDYTLDLLGDVDVTSAVETQILRHDGTSFINEYNDVFFLRVKAREAINKGEVVYIFDAHNSNVVGVKKARADSASTMPCIGVAYQTLALGDEGLVVAFGKANGIAANFTEGQTMYVSPTTAGAVTNTKPTGTTHLIQNVGILMQAHATNAVVKITGVGRTNDIPNEFTVPGNIEAASLITTGGTSSQFVKGDGSLDGSTYLTSYTETDPVFTAHPAAGITVAGGGDVSKGETAFGWGDHGAAGYLTTETDPVFTAHPAAGVTVAGGGDISQGETAFAWGDHAAAGYLVPEACAVRLATSVVGFPSGAYTLILQPGNWASANPNFNTATGLYTVPSTGSYRISWGVSFRYTASGQTQTSRLYVNGANAAQGVANATGSWPIGNNSLILALNAGDTVSLYAYISASGKNLVGDAVSLAATHLNINKVA